MPGFCICKCCTRFWICLNMAEWCPMAGFWICLVNVSEGFKQASGSKYARAQNMASLWISEGYKGCWICLNEPAYALIIMSQYEWICLNNAEYDWICRHIPDKTECWICQNYSVSDAVHSIRSLNLLSSYWDRCILNTVKHLRWSVLQKEWCLNADAQQEIFHGRKWGLWN